MPFAEWVEPPTKDELAGLSLEERKKRQQRAYQKRCQFKHPEYKTRAAEKRKKRYAEDPAYRRKSIDASLASRKRRWSTCIEWNRKQYAANPLRFRDYHLRYKHGITHQQWVELFKGQGEVCALCGTPEPGGRRGWATDHNHETGAIRGVLCNRCNMVLGLVGDSTDWLAKANTYLHRGDVCIVRVTPKRYLITEKTSG